MSYPPGEYLSPKLMRRTGYYSEGPVYMHWCPACDSLHPYFVEQPTRKGARWSFDGNVASPTFSPSMNISWDSGEERGEERYQGRCHYFVEAGKLKYCGDSSHSLSGQTIDLPDIPRQQWLLAGVIPPT